MKLCQWSPQAWTLEESTLSEQRKKIADDVPGGKNGKKRHTEEVIYNIKRDSDQTRIIVKKKKKRKCQVHIRRSPLPYTQNSVPVIDNPRGPDF